MNQFRKFCRYAWAGPNTLAAIAIGILLRGRFERVDGVVEISGPVVSRVLQRMPVPARAMTIGHAVFGQDRYSLRVTRVHERVHVQQYERWGPFFIGAYLSASLWLYLRRRDAYRDNPFEVEAYAIDTPDFQFTFPTDEELDSLEHSTKR